MTSLFTLSLFWVVRVLVEMRAPYMGRVYNPCCGSGGVFVQKETFVEEDGGRIGEVVVSAQESYSTTRRLAMKIESSKMTSGQASTNKPVKRKTNGADA